MPEGRILSEDTTYSIPAMQGNIGLLCSKIQVNSTYGTYSFVGPQALVRPLLRSGQYNQDLVPMSRCLTIIQFCM